MRNKKTLLIYMIISALMLGLSGCGSLETRSTEPAAEQTTAASAREETQAEKNSSVSAPENGEGNTQSAAAEKSEGNTQNAAPETDTGASPGTESEAVSDTQESITVPEDITVGTEEERGFINDNVLHTEDYGDIHYSSYIPESYDGSEPYALFITLPGYEGLYFQGVGANMVEDFGPESIQYNDKMIVLSPQLNDWGETSADQAIALIEYFLSHYNVDEEKVYLHGMSGGGETGSLVMGKRPELFAGFLATSTQWDGDLNAVAQARTPVYLAIGSEDSYYGPESLEETYNTLHELYEEQGLTDEEIDELLVLNEKDQDYFSERGFSDQHAGGQAFASDEEVMGWLFSR